MDGKIVDANTRLAENEFRCNYCLRVFEKVRSDEEAMAEAEARFGAKAMAGPTGTLCDNCFRKLGFYNVPAQTLPRQSRERRARILDQN